MTLSTALKILTMTKTRMKYSALSPGELEIWGLGHDLGQTWEKSLKNLQ